MEQNIEQLLDENMALKAKISKLEVMLNATEPPPGDYQSFLEWGTKKGLSMEQHPLFAICMDPTTAAARDGWRGAVDYYLRPIHNLGKSLKEMESNYRAEHCVRKQIERNWQELASAIGWDDEKVMESFNSGSPWPYSSAVEQAKHLVSSLARITQYGALLPADKPSVQLTAHEDDVEGICYLKSDGGYLAICASDICHTPLRHKATWFTSRGLAAHVKAGYKLDGYEIVPE